MNDAISGAGERSFFRRLLGFGGVSLVGLGIDVLGFTLLMLVVAQPWLANLISASAAVTFVFFASVRHIFRYQGGGLFSRYLLYVSYQIVAVAAASALIAWIYAVTRFPALICKAAILPLTFSANYFAMRLLTQELRKSAW